MADPSSIPAADTTALLLTRAREGDAVALDALFARFAPALRRWAHRRLPAGVRDLNETDDLVQVALTRAFGRIGEFEHRGQGAFFAYLRQILLNLVRNELRRHASRPGHGELHDGLPDASASVVEQVAGRELMERYERALATLPDDKREAVILRVEMGLPYAEIADIVGSPSANAARVMVSRALVSLARGMEP